MVQETDNDPGKRIQANQQIGIIGSSLEHQVLEQLNGEQGFSAVKAIQLANLQGQKIYTITKDNYEETLPMLHLAPASIDKLLHCNKGITQAFAILMSVFLTTVSFVVVSLFAMGGVFLVTLGVTVIVSLLNLTIMQSIDSACGYH